MSNNLGFIDALNASEPAANLAEPMMLYGQFIGSWDGTLIVHRASGERFETSCEVHFGWALGGRAVQDAWIAPSRVGRNGEPDLMYGTTLRVYDPKADEWQITWNDPVRQTFNRMVGRRSGEDIVQEYRNAAGTICQWCFTEITPTSFHWVSRESTDERVSWRITGEFFLRRRQRAADTGQGSDPSQLRAFDFWLGSWRVSDSRSGKDLGVSRVSSILGGRVLHEQWSGADGYSGESFNIFDKDRQCWHQSWVGDNGTLLLLDGDMSAGSMDLKGRDMAGEQQRIRWTPKSDGSVVQFWESSKDNGATWTCRFDGVYRRK